MPASLCGFYQQCPLPANSSNKSGGERAPGGQSRSPCLPSLLSRSSGRVGLPSGGRDEMDALGPRLGREKVESLLGCGSSTESNSSPGIDPFCPILTWEGGRDSKLNIPLESQRWMESRSATFPSRSQSHILAAPPTVSPDLCQTQI